MAPGPTPGGLRCRRTPWRSLPSSERVCEGRFTLQTFATNLHVPLGKPVLVGGTSVPAKGDRPQAMYLVVELTAAK